MIKEYKASWAEMLLTFVLLAFPILISYDKNTSDNNIKNADYTYGNDLSKAFTAYL